jgi:hypothetical protein
MLGSMPTRLRAQFPDLADALQSVSEEERTALVERVAFVAASITGVVVPDGSISELENGPPN